MFLLSFILATPVLGKDPTATRLLFQDRDAQAIKWVDLIEKEGQPSTTEPKILADFPKLDKEKQSLVQMSISQGYLLAGVRDEEDGAFGSGWILAHTGVEYIDHGDHGHWKYPEAPAIRKTSINESQGNPAHLYVYQDIFYIANDANDGFTRLDPARIPESGDIPTGFHRGGGNHITLAIANGLQRFPQRVAALQLLE